MTRYRSHLFYLLLFALTVTLSMIYYKDKGHQKYGTEIFADKAGYYGYLPATFFFRFDPQNFPGHIVEKTGYGFTFDTIRNKVLIKYTYGVSLLVAPFFLTTHLISRVFNLPEEGGFSIWYYKMVNIAAAFYLILGIIFLQKLLARYFRPGLQFLLILVLFTGTNIFYYAVIETLMSHIYSFCLFSLFLFALTRYLDQLKYHWFIVLSITGALIVVIRPTNLIFLLVFFFWDIQSPSDITGRIRLLFKPLNLVTLIFTWLAVFLPQLIYWKYTWGSIIHYSYGDEGFNNWANPQIPEVWFSPRNGLFLYSPLVLMMVAGSVYMIVKRIGNGKLILILFLVMSYVFASWDCWFFGCSYGSRPFVEYYAILILPMGYLVQAIIRNKKRIFKSLIAFLMAGMIFYNVLNSWYFPGWYRGGEWNFTSWYINLAGAGLLPAGYLIKSQTTGPVQVNASRKYCSQVVLDLSTLDCKSPNLVKIKTRIRKTDAPVRQLNAYMVCSLERQKESILYQNQSIDSLIEPVMGWQPVEINFEIPDWLPDDALIKTYCWNRKDAVFYIDTVYVSYHYKK